jgi:hypothetical protein
MTEKRNILVDHGGKAIVLEDIDLFFNSDYTKGYRFATEEEIADAAAVPIACENFGADCEHCETKPTCAHYDMMTREINESMCCDVCGKEGIFGTCDHCLKQEHYNKERRQTMKCEIRFTNIGNGRIAAIRGSKSDNLPAIIFPKFPAEDGGRYLCNVRTPVKAKYFIRNGVEHVVLNAFYIDTLWLPPPRPTIERVDKKGPKMKDFVKAQMEKTAYRKPKRRKNNKNDYFDMIGG